MPLSHFALALLVVLIWGINYIVIALGLQEMPPILLCFTRFFLTSLPAVFFIRRPVIPFKMVLLYGLVMFALQFSFIFLGMKEGVSAGLTSILIQTHIFFTTLLGVIFLAEKLHVWQILGAIVSFSGIGLVGMHVGGSLPLSGLILVLSGAACWGVGNLVSKKIGGVDMVALVVWGSFVAWPPLLIASFYFEGSERIISSIQNLTWISLVAILYLAYLSTFLAFGIWSWLLHRHKLSTIAPFTLLVPILAIAGSVLVFGEPLQDWKISAAVLVLFGLCINLLGPYLHTKIN